MNYNTPNIVFAGESFGEASSNVSNLSHKVVWNSRIYGYWIEVGET